MDVVKPATVSAVAACATLVLLSTTPPGHAEPRAMRAPVEMSSNRSAPDAIVAASAVGLPHIFSRPGDAGHTAASLAVRGHGGSPFRRPRFEAGSVASWEQLIAEASRRFGLPAAWVRGVMQVESAGRITLNGRPITSPAGAMGLMQVMPATFAEMARRYGLGSDPYDPRANILGGTAYMREMYDRFGAAHFLAAYNAGPGRVEDHLRTGRPLPEETRRYVKTLAPGLDDSVASYGYPTSPEVHDLTSLRALRDAARPLSRRIPALFPTSVSASVFVAPNDRSSAGDRQLGQQSNDTLFVHLAREAQRRRIAGADRPED